MGSSKLSRWVAGGLSRSTDQHSLYLGIRVANHLLYGECAPARWSRAGGRGGRGHPAERPLARSPAGRGGSVRHRTRARYFPDGCRGHPRSPLGALGTHRGGACRPGAAGSIRAKAAPRVPESLRNIAGRAAGLSTLGTRLPPRAARPERPHLEPRCRSRLDERGRRRAEIAVLPLLRQDQHRRHHPLEFLHGLRKMRRVPQGHLPAVEKLDAPLRQLQQPVLPEVRRVHAERRRDAAEQMVRGMPRSRRLLQWPVREADCRPDRYARGARRAGLHFVPRDHARRGHDGQRRIHDRVPAPA